MIAGAVFTYYRWKTECYDEMVKVLQGTAQRVGWGSFATGSSEVHWSAYAPVFAAVLAFLVLLINLLTPVPEVYSERCIDPKVIEVQQNSWTESEQVQLCKPMRSLCMLVHVYCRSKLTIVTLRLQSVIAKACT